MIEYVKALCVLMIFVGSRTINVAVAEDLSEYATTCDDEVQASVEGFDCTKGYEIPMEGTAGGDCKKPPYLDSAACRKGSRLGVQATGSDKIAIVWLCRKKEVQNANNALFDDVAVIQTNFETGATCFYQRLEPSRSTAVTFRPQNKYR